MNMPPRKEKIFEITSSIPFNFKREGATNATLRVKSFFLVIKKYQFLSY